MSSGNVQRKRDAMMTRQEMEAEELRQHLVLCRFVHDSCQFMKYFEHF